MPLTPQEVLCGTVIPDIACAQYRLRSGIWVGTNRSGPIQRLEERWTEDRGLRTISNYPKNLVYRVFNFNDMKYIVESEKTVAQAQADLEEAVARHGFGVLHTYDLKQTLHNKGFDLDNECIILEVCNPRQAKSVLDSDMSMNVALPCRISVYSEGGQTKLGMISPKSMLEMLSDSDDLMQVASEVEEATVKMIEEAK